MSYWQNYPKFFVSLQKAWWGAAATEENNWAYDYLPKLDKLYDVLQAFELMNQGKINGYICQGFNPVGSFPNKAKIDRRPVEAEVPRDHRSAAHRDGRVLEELRRAQRCQVGRDPDHRVPPALDLLRRGRRLAHQLRPLAAVALEGRAAARARPSRTPTSSPASSCASETPTLKDGGTFPDPITKLTWPYKIAAAPSPEELAMEYNGKALTDSGRPDDKTKIAGQGRRAAVRLRPVARRRHTASRLLDLRRRLDAGRQPDGAARQRRSVRHRPDARLGLGLAGQPAHPLQRRVGRPEDRQALDREPQR